jgi:hypothetical protein
MGDWATADIEASASRTSGWLQKGSIVGFGIHLSAYYEGVSVSQHCDNDLYD